MSSVCISHCVNDAQDPRMPSPRVRATYVSLYRWPESDVEFVRSARRGGYGAPRVVDTISCRQMYLRSYTFSREEDHEKTPSQRWCFGGGSGKESAHEKTSSSMSCFSGRAKAVSDTTSSGRSFSKERSTSRRGRQEREDESSFAGGRAERRRKKKKKKEKKGLVARRVKEVSCSALLRFFHRLLSCAATVDVVDDKF